MSPGLFLYTRKLSDNTSYFWFSYRHIIKTNSNLLRVFFFRFAPGQGGGGPTSNTGVVGGGGSQDGNFPNNLSTAAMMAATATATATATASVVALQERQEMSQYNQVSR